MSPPLHRAMLLKPDGRRLTLYGRSPIDPSITAPCPQGGPATRPSSHLRWHPLRGEWVVYAGHRQSRTYLPPPEWNPLAPTMDPSHPTEVPSGNWEVAVFDNLFPALGGFGTTEETGFVDTAPCGGTCEVVVFTQDPKQSLGASSLDRVEMVISVWADRTVTLGARDDVTYVFPFENRGVEVGVTLHHPHGQIYAYPFIPPSAARSLLHQQARPGLLADLIAKELASGARVLYSGEHAVAFVPVCARWAYEIWIAPIRSKPSLAALTPEERLDFARALRVALRKLDGLWNRPMPYVLTVHQAPVKGEHPYAHVHVEIYPWARAPGRLKYLAGSEVGAGTFTADTFPERTAAELRAVEIDDA